MTLYSKIRNCTLIAVVVILVSVAIVFSVFRAMIPYAEGYTESIRHELSSQIGLHVEIGSMDVEMYWLTPGLKLTDVVIYKKNSEDILISFKESTIALAWASTLKNLIPMPGEINLIGADVRIERTQEDSFIVQGINVGGNGSGNDSDSEKILAMLGEIDIALLDINISWIDRINKEEYFFDKTNIQFMNNFGNKVFGLDIVLPEPFGSNLQIVAEVRGNLAEPEKTSGLIYVKGDNLALDRWLDKTKLSEKIQGNGRINTEAWIEFENMNINSVAGVVHAVDLSLSNEALNTSWDSKIVEGDFFWRKKDEGWRFDLKNFSLEKGGNNWMKKTTASLIYDTDKTVTVDVSYVRLDDVLRLPLLNNELNNNEIYDKVVKSSISGDLYNTKIIYEYEDTSKSSLRTTAHDFGFYDKDKNIFVRGLDGKATVKENKVVLDLDSDDVEMEINGLFRETTKLNYIKGRVEISKNKNIILIQSDQLQINNDDFRTTSRLNISASDDLILDIQTDFYDVVGKSAYKYYPVTVLSESLIEWLDSSIIGGTVPAGSFIFKGNVDQFPFHNNEGTFEVVFSERNMQLRYLEDWPVIDNLASDVRFYNASLQINNASGDVYSGHVSSVDVSIDDLDFPYLKLQGNINSSTGDLQRYVQSSGLKEIIGPALSQFRAKGDAIMDLTLGVPIDDDDVPVKTNGKISFFNNEFYFEDLDYHFTEINGQLEFSDNSMSGKKISAKFYQQPVDINISTVDVNNNPEILINLQGYLSAKSLLHKFDLENSNFISGHSNWDVTLKIPDDVENLFLKVVAKSDLNGVSLELSDTINKDKNTSLPTTVTVAVFDDSVQVDVDAENIFKSHSKLNDKDEWSVYVESDVLTGTAQFPYEFYDDSLVTVSINDITLDAFTSTNSKSSTVTKISPSDIPSLNVNATTVKYQNWQFDDVIINSIRNPYGMIITNVDLKAPAMRLTGSGSWLSRWANDHESSFKLQVSTTNIGSTMAGFGFTKSLDKAKIQSTFDWKWRAEPYNFSWDLLDDSSTAQIKSGKGVIYEVEPGAGGRILGLLNVTELKKRLFLQFEDVTNKGFNFDSITGDFEFSGGNIEIENLDIIAAAADIRFDGRVGMTKQDYDLEMEVIPHNTAATFTIGTIAGGPVVGAVLAGLQKILGLDDLNHDVYTIKGSWDKPEVKLIKESKDSS